MPCATAYPREAKVFILFRYLHFIGIFTLCSALVLEHVLVKPALTRAELRKLAGIDAVFGVAAALVLGAGLWMWFRGDKPPSFYSRNPVFMAKITLFAVAALLSLHPTIFFLRNRKGAGGDSVPVPRSIKMCLRLELTLIFIIPLLAVLMARGIGLP